MRTSAGIFSNRVAWALLVTGTLVLFGCSSGRHATRHIKPEYAPPAYGEELTARKGVASWYGPGFHGKLTASGEPFNMYDLTCAHNTFPLGTKLKVTNLLNGKSVYVTVNDRGPFVKDREIDLSYAAAKELDMIGPGTAEVMIEPIGHDARYVKYDKSYSIEKGPFTVQIASFSKRFNAVQLVKDLKHRYNSLEPYVFETDLDGDRLYRVRVGKFKTREEAEGFAEKLVDDGYSTMVCTFEEQI